MYQSEVPYNVPDKSNYFLFFYALPFAQKLFHIPCGIGRASRRKAYCRSFGHRLRILFIILKCRFTIDIYCLDSAVFKIRLKSFGTTLVMLESDEPTISQDCITSHNAILFLIKRVFFSTIVLGSSSSNTPETTFQNLFCLCP